MGKLNLLILCVGRNKHTDHLLSRYGYSSELWGRFLDLMGCLWVRNNSIGELIEGRDDDLFSIKKKVF